MWNFAGNQSKRKLSKQQSVAKRFAPGSLWQFEAASLGVWCLTVWFGSSVVPLLWGWYKASISLIPGRWPQYSQLEKEVLAIIFDVKKFHNYIYSRQFTIESDHQPLSYLFGESKGTSPMASSRIQRWALTLSAYHYTIHYKAGRTLNNADALNPLQRPVTTTADCLPVDFI